MKINRVATDSGSKFLFVSNPDRSILYDLLKRSEGGKICQEQDLKPRVLASIRQQKIEILDLEPIVKASGPVDSLFPLGGRANHGSIGGHFASPGYKLMADSIFDRVAEISGK